MMGVEWEGRGCREGEKDVDFACAGIGKLKEKIDQLYQTRLVVALIGKVYLIIP